jgi:hypothetical protein
MESNILQEINTKKGVICVHHTSIETISARYIVTLNDDKSSESGVLKRCETQLTAFNFAEGLYAGIEIIN